MIEYFKWLEFEKVDHYDNMKGANTLFEEDIQITLPDGILVIECKGIGGTSTDSDCGQISKIKHRRCKERGKFDVYALYIVNHQRYLPPLNRQNPPFLDHQIQDAINDERGLLTTWQLFNLYFDVDNSIITKEEARKSILSFGLVNFRPDNLTFIYSPTELFKDGTVCIVDIDNVEIKVNEDLLIEKNGRFEVAKVLKIKKDDLSVGQADKGQLGLQLNIRIPKHSKLWKRMY